MRCTAVLFSSLLILPSCSSWFFSGAPTVDRSRPVALLETTGGVEYAATTIIGILSLGRTATAGPCRVHYFLGPTPLIETGELHSTGSVFTEAEIDLKTQLARLLDRSPTTKDTLWVMWTPDGENCETVPVKLAVGDGLAGDLLRDPGVELPAGATLLCRGPKGESMFAGLIAGRATVHEGPAAGRYYVVAGVDRVRELLAIPRKYPVDMAPKYRSDDIIVMKPLKLKPPELTIEPGATGATGLEGLMQGFGGATSPGSAAGNGGGQ
jgi:hypothetical protein